MLFKDIICLHPESYKTHKYKMQSLIIKEGGTSSPQWALKG
jgi:hypothetical protein